MPCAGETTSMSPVTCRVFCEFLDLRFTHPQRAQLFLIDRMLESLIRFGSSGHGRRS